MSKFKSGDVLYCTDGQYESNILVLVDERGETSHRTLIGDDDGLADRLLEGNDSWEVACTLEALDSKIDEVLKR